MAIDNEDCESLIISTSEINNSNDSSIVEGNHQLPFQSEDVNTINLNDGSNNSSNPSPILDR